MSAEGSTSIVLVSCVTFALIWSLSDKVTVMQQKKEEEQLKQAALLQRL